MGDQIAGRLILLQSQYYGSDIGMHNIKKIDLNLLVVLDALLDERNVTRASARLGYTQPTISGMLARLLRSEARQIRLAIAPPIIEGLTDALARGQIDLAVTIPEFAMSDLPSRLLYRERYVVAVRPRHPLARRATMTVECFCNYDHVVVSPTGGSFEGPTDQALARLKLRRKVRYSVSSFLLLPEILQTDDLVALIPSRLLRENDKRLVVLKPPVAVPGFDVIAVWHPRVDRDAAHRWLRSRLVEIAKIP